MDMYRSYRYTAIDYAYLGVVAVVSGIIFFITWYIYYFGDTLGGPIVARLISYGLWFIGGPLGASIIRKPGSAFLGETLGALVETLIPTVGGFTNLIYGAIQGLLSEIIYLVSGYRRFDVLAGLFAGAIAGPGAVVLDAILFGEIATINVVILWLIASVISGAVYGAIASSVALYIRR